MKFLKNSRHVKWFDKLIGGALHRQLAILLVFIVVVVSCWAIAIILLSKIFPEFYIGDSSVFWWTLSFFFDPGELLNLEKPGIQVLSVMITVSGLILLGGFLISIITNYYFQRIQKFKNGRANYRFTNHSIIIGFDPIAPEYIIKLYNDLPHSEIVLHTSQDAEFVLRSLQSFLPSNIEKKLFVLQGERNSHEEIQRLHPETSAKVVILGEPDENGHDSLNIDCANIIAGEIKKNYQKSKRKPVPVFCHVFFLKPQIFQISKEFEHFDKQYIHFLPFNFYENWARLVFQNTGWLPINKETPDKIFTPIDQNKIKIDTNFKLHFFIFGFNSMGHAIVMQLIRICHFPNNQNTTITVFDKNAKEQEELFKAHYPGIKDVRNITLEFKSDSVYSEETRNAIHDVAKNENILSYAIVCYKEPDLSISAGLNLPKEMYRRNIPVIIRQEYLYGFGKVLPPNVKLFGMRNVCLFDNIIEDSLAESAHISYLETLKQLGWYNPESENQVEWKELKPTYRWANRYLSDSYNIKLAVAGKKVTLFNNKLQVDSFTKEETDRLAPLEHSRWIAERALSGWQSGSARNNELKINHLMVPWEDVDENTRKFDRIIYDYIPDALQKIKLNEYS
jgi:hypothetical protein